MSPGAATAAEYEGATAAYAALSSAYYSIIPHVSERSQALRIIDNQSYEVQRGETDAWKQAGHHQLNDETTPTSSPVFQTPFPALLIAPPLRTGHKPNASPQFLVGTAPLGGFPTPETGQLLRIARLYAAPFGADSTRALGTLISLLLIAGTIVFMLRKRTAAIMNKFIAWIIRTEAAVNLLLILLLAFVIWRPRFFIFMGLMIGLARLFSIPLWPGEAPYPGAWRMTLIFDPQAQLPRVLNGANCTPPPSKHQHAGSLRTYTACPPAAGNPLIYLRVLTLAPFDTRTLAGWSKMIAFLLLNRCTTEFDALDPIGPQMLWA
ncbi:hypothetical protein DFH09DRAFT_1342323 [Mycena vulgaris]|nr:hypothetical protein DFH09DRAFT_1342323 [Mycena vulgaris]